MVSQVLAIHWLFSQGFSANSLIYKVVKKQPKKIALWLKLVEVEPISIPNANILGSLSK
jgi:hypothetical protein